METCRASKSSEKVPRVSLEFRVDRLSSLPDDITHRILSLLQFGDLSRFGSLSKRCRELHLSTPSFRLDLSKVDISTCDKWSNSVDRFLDHRGKSRILHFGIRFDVREHIFGNETPCICEGVGRRFISWIENALRCKVEILDLDISRIHLANGVGDITIESSSLKSFSISSNSWTVRRLKIIGHKLKDVRIDWRSEWCTTVSIFASDIKNLEWDGITVNHQFGTLERAELSLADVIRRDLSPDVKAVDFLTSVHRVKALTLNHNTIKALFKKGIPPLENVFDFSMKIGNFSIELVLALVPILRAMPNLTILDVKSSTPPRCLLNECSGLTMEYWRSSKLPFLSQLKDVTVDLNRHFYGSNQIEFIRFILEDAQSLRKMVIIYPLRLGKGHLKKLTESEKISNAHVVYCRHSRGGKGKISKEDDVGIREASSTSESSQTSMNRSPKEAREEFHGEKADKSNEPMLRSSLQPSGAKKLNQMSQC
ncbi:hypothetical protein DVH24_036620 [Malus domestica]|uniref:F-box domain-containing protein n=1 Tax=Malus domestica TaxID=3750 RepID=A0A498IGS8_MALDO|nr:hypothetical protein DVH24_036620 [Malus domestica]